MLKKMRQKHQTLLNNMHNKEDTKASRNIDLSKLQMSHSYASYRKYGSTNTVVHLLLSHVN